ncbi:tRNA pseudouridine(38,39,40) synthase TruA, partial [Epulopiscium sp. SCG-B10WGA-EpuloA2]
KITRQNVKVIGAGRTDAGVHAMGQVCLINIDTKINNYGLLQALNNKLPKDIVIKEIEDAPIDFHPTFSSKFKMYRYQILNSKVSCPFVAEFVYYFPHDLNILLMKEASSKLIGTHDFKAFCASKSNVLQKGTSTIRTIFDIKIEKGEDDIIKIDVCGDGFLYNMVRIIVGTLIDAGLNRGMSVEEIIEKKDRKNAGKTAPASGLIMVGIEY